MGIPDLFDIVYKSPIAKRPDKKELFKEFIELYGKPKFYIGQGDKDITACRNLGIATISVNWVSSGETKGDYDINSVRELERILS